MRQGAKKDIQTYIGHPCENFVNNIIIYENKNFRKFCFSEGGVELPLPTVTYRVNNEAKLMQSKAQIFFSRSSWFSESFKTIEVGKLWSKAL